MESSCVWPIEMIMKWLKSGKLVLDPPYQRGLVWSQALKLDLIDSIRRGYPIPCFFFLERGDTMECFDGKNRINAIHEFVNDKWPHRLSDGGKAEFFSDMPQREQDDFTEHNIVVRKMIGQNWTEATVRDFFKRIQNGASLQYDEEINALDTPLVNVAKEIARRLASTIASLPAINKARHKYLGTIINIIAFHDSVHGPLGGLNVLPDKQKSLISYSKRHTEEQTDAMSVEALTAFVRDVMELCTAAPGTGTRGRWPASRLASRSAPWASRRPRCLFSGRGLPRTLAPSSTTRSGSFPPRETSGRTARTRTPERTSAAATTITKKATT